MSKLFNNPIKNDGINLYNEINLEEYFQLKVINPNDIYDYIKNNELLTLIYNIIIPKIKTFEINCFIVPLPFSNLEVWWTDFEESYLEHFFGKKCLNKSHIYITIKFNKDLTINSIEDIIVNHKLSLQEKQIVYDIFREYLPLNFNWDGTTSKKMVISYLKNSNPIPELEIQDSDIYPSAEIFIEAIVDKKNNEYNIDSFIDNPYELSNFKLFWDKIEENCDIIDNGYNYSNKTFLIDFLVYSIKNIELIKSLSELKEISFENFVLKVIDVSGVLKFAEDEEIELN